MADPKDTRSAPSATAAAPSAAVAPTDPKRDYRAKHRIVGADSEIKRGAPLRLTEAEARALGDAVEPQR